MPDIIDLGGQLSGIGDTILQNRELADKQRIKDLFVGGLPRDASGQVNYSEVADRVAKAGGGLDTLISLSKLSEEQKADAAFRMRYGGGGDAPSTPPASTASPPSLTPRPPVSSQSQADPYDPMTVTPQQVATANRPPPSVLPGSGGAPIAPAPAPPPAPVARPTPTLVAAPLSGAPASPPGGAPQAQPSIPATPPGGVPQTSGNPAAGDINGLVAAASNPRLSAGNRELAKVMLQNALQASQLTNEQKEYVWYRAQGGQLSFGDRQVELKRAGVPLPENLQLKARLAVDQEALKEVQTGLAIQRKLQPAIERAEIAVRAAPEGAAGVLAATLGRLVGGFIDLPQGATEAQVLQSITTQLAPLYKQAGATSNTEMQLYMQAAPYLGDGKEANLQKIALFKKLTQRASEIATVFRNNMGDPNLEQKFEALGPVFTDQERKTLEAAAGREASPEGESFSDKFDRRTSSGVRWSR